MSSSAPTVATVPEDRRPPGYPAELEERVVLDDGRGVWLRPVVPEDQEELARAIARADVETLRRRFLGGRAPRSDAELRRMVEVDYRQRFALAAFAPDGRGVAIGRYDGRSTWPAVEVAVAVDPQWRQVGLARELMRRVALRAAGQGATRLTADFYADNVRVHRLLAEAGVIDQRSLDHGVVQEGVALDSVRLAVTPD